MSTTIKVEKIVEPTSYLNFNNEIIGVINNILELNQCLIQIKKSSLDGYSLSYNNIEYDIQPNGRIFNGKGIYPTYSEQLKEIMGF